MVAGYHLIWTAYGYWLPNEPRGSTSLEIRVATLKPLGGIHFGRKKVQPSAKQIAEFHEKAQDVLKHAVLALDKEDIELVGKAIGQNIAAKGYICHAGAVMPDHVHLLIRRGRDSAEQMIEAFQEKTRAALIDAGKRSPTHPTWTKGPGWKRFMNTAKDFERTIKYIRENPLEIGWPEQFWDFVSPYDGWLPLSV
jgi:REP element-mobilizing transposase RayT